MVEVWQISVSWNGNKKTNGQPQQANYSSEGNFPSDNPFLVLMEKPRLMWLEKKSKLKFRVKLQLYLLHGEGRGSGNIRRSVDNCFRDIKMICAVNGYLCKSFK